MSVGVSQLDGCQWLLGTSSHGHKLPSYYCGVRRKQAGLTGRVRVTGPVPPGGALSLGYQRLAEAAERGSILGESLVQDGGAIKWTGTDDNKYRKGLCRAQGLPTEGLLPASRTVRAASAKQGTEDEEPEVITEEGVQ